MNIAAIGALPWKEILLLAPGMVETARRLYEGLKKRDRQVAEQDTPPLDSIVALSRELHELQSRLEEVASNQSQLAEFITRMTTYEEAQAQGLQAVSRRLTILLWISGSALLVASLAVVLVFVVKS